MDFEDLHPDRFRTPTSRPGDSIIVTRGRTNLATRRQDVQKKRFRDLARASAEVLAASLRCLLLLGTVNSCKYI